MRHMSNDDARAEVKHYLELPYTFILERHDDGEKPYYSMRVLELEGCITTGDTIEEAARDIQDAMKEWLQLNIKLGRTIPPPLKSRRYSGKVVIRMPPTLHESLMFSAVREGVSLNQYLVASLSRTEGHHEGIRARAKSATRAGRRQR
jgi:predicted RNase H-like HicB family nuclease